MHKKTKAELALSLKKLTETMPLEKITIGDIAADCGVNRQTFYYHFHDIYELVEWIFSESANAIAEKKSFGMWRQGLIELCLAVKQSRNFIRACYESEYCHKKLLHYLFNETYTLINEIMGRSRRGRGSFGRR
jgi:AcrR family transcriptional regulator